MSGNITESQKKPESVEIEEQESDGCYICPQCESASMQKVVEVEECWTGKFKNIMYEEIHEYWYCYQCGFTGSD